MTSIIQNCIQKNLFCLILEAGVNYYDIAKKLNISLIDAAKLMIKKAKEANCHAIKFQTYKAATLASINSPSYWDTTKETCKSQYELFTRYDKFGYEQYKELALYASSIGIEFFSTPFDKESADYLFDLMNIYKISSSDFNNIPFITYIAKKGKPIIISAGAANEKEIHKALNTIRQYNDRPCVLMHCVLEYPTPLENANLNKIISLKRLAQNYKDITIGYSDHTVPDKTYDVIKTAYNLGATIIEKHWTLDKMLKGCDHYHAIDLKDAKNIIAAIAKIDKIRGGYELKANKTESNAIKYARRSIVAAIDIKAGCVLQENMLTYKRPGNGIPIDKFYLVIGKKAKIDIKKDTVIKTNMIQGQI